MKKSVLLDQTGDEAVPPSTAVQRLLLAPTEHPVATLPDQEPDTTVVTIQNGGPQAASPALPIGQQTVSQNERNQQLRAQPSQEQTQVGDFPIIGASRQLAMLVARYARALACIEWRDMERLMAEVFESLGFAAALTPPSKMGARTSL
ncbi:hypothetical protein [Tateyamaria sp. ANG-S1]|uniref:hypothetical protein n=1 Tax=Tateyamaria sp. ANG-S1 TaxID=1577905 RepID=UPI00068DEAC3|nr:hypothetical protein [Tateyamaria sp. ANG-S1]